MIYRDKTKDFLENELAKEKAIYEDILKQNIKIDISRGKPCKEQLDLSMEMLNMINSVDDLPQEGADIRNYGGIEGLQGMRELFGEMLGVKAENVLVGGNSSLNMMYDTIQRCMQFGLNGSTPWNKLDKVKFLCPAPGYDRHFSLTAVFGIELITIPMDENGPIMEVVESLVANDEAIKGIWCVPKYSNPTGIVFSDEVVDRLAKMPTKANDFRIFWDNAYAIHFLYEDQDDTLLEILSECEKAGKPDMVYEFCSTSKITFPGGGISAVAASKENLEYFKKTMTIQTIGYDKINQLRHVRYFKDINGMKEHMKKHAAIVRPKFEAVLEVLEKELGGLELGTWTKPHGGYFISFHTMEGCAKKVVGKCKEAGVVLTGAGATYPYKKDPKDDNIRLAPTFPSSEELSTATDLFVLCVKLVSVEELLADMA